MLPFHVRGTNTLCRAGEILSSQPLLSHVGRVCRILLAASLLTPAAFAGSLTQVDAESPCLSERLSNIGEAACAEIAGSSDVSDASYYNHFPDDWLLFFEAGGAVPPVDAYYEHLAAMLTATRSSTEIASLNLKGDLSILADALYDLHLQQSADKKSELRPLVRFLLGNEETQIGPAFTALTSLLPADPEDWGIDVVVVGLGLPPTADWNHAKMAVRDNYEAVTGSVELDSETELAMKVACGAARDAKDFFEEVWSTFPFRAGTARDCASNRSSYCTSACFEDSCWEKNIPAPPAPWCSLQDAPVLSLGRGKFYPSSFLGPRLDLSADRAIYAALDSAQNDLFLMQRSLSFLSIIVDRLFDSLSAAAMRGVETRITVGAQASPFFQAPDALLGELADHMDEYFRDQGLDADERRQAHQRVHLAEYQAHAKYFSVDDQAFYIGSQNLYAGSFSDGDPPTFLPDLYEHGFLVDDVVKTAEIDGIMENVWSDLEADCDDLAAECKILGSPFAYDSNIHGRFDASGGGQGHSGSCTVVLDFSVDRGVIDHDFTCPGQVDGQPVMVDLYILGDVGLGGEMTGTLSGSVIYGGNMYTDSTPITGEFLSLGLVELNFTGLELGVTYGGSFIGRAF